jgi:internalin A
MTHSGPSHPNLDLTQPIDIIPMPGSTRTQREVLQQAIIEDLGGPVKGTANKKWPIGPNRRHMLPTQYRNMIIVWEEFEGHPRLAVRGIDNESLRNFEFPPDLEHLSIRFVSDVVDISPLAGLPLKSLQISLLRCPDATAIETMVNLESINIVLAGKAPIDFTKLPRLKRVSFGYNKAYESVFDCDQIERLGIGNCPRSAFDRVCKLTSLKTLFITQSSIENADRLGELTNISLLSLSYFSKLASFEFLRKLKDLRRLELSCCKRFDNLGDLNGLGQLEEIYLDSVRELIADPQLVDLPKLRRLLVYGNSRVKDPNAISQELIDQLELCDVRYFGFTKYIDKREDS